LRENFASLRLNLILEFNKIKKPLKPKPSGF